MDPDWDQKDMTLDNCFSRFQKTIVKINDESKKKLYDNADAAGLAMG